MIQKQLHARYILPLAAVLMLLVSACSKSSDSSGTLPTVTTYSTVGNVTSSTATIYAKTTSVGTTSLTAIGICYSSVNTTPTIADSKTSSGVDTLTYTTTLTGLAANTKYYVRAYATNSSGTSYGSVVSFTTTTVTYAVTATVSTFAGSTAGLTNGSALSAQFYNPEGFCFDGSSNLYIADSFNNIIRKVSSTGTVSTYAGAAILGKVDGALLTAQFYDPINIIMDSQNNFFVADAGNKVIRKISSAGVVSTFAGSGVSGITDGTGTAAKFQYPHGMVFDSQGNLFVTDEGGCTIREITTGAVVTTFAGNSSAVAGLTDSTGTNAQFNAPMGLAINTTTGVMYVADSKNHAIRQVTSAGVVTTLVGNNTYPALLGTPVAVILDSSASNLIIVDSSGRILQYNFTTKVVNTLAGAYATTGYVDGTNTTARFYSPMSITKDSSGNYYVCDYYNHVIRKITITTRS